MIPGVIMRMPDGQEYECTGTVPHTQAAIRAGYSAKTAHVAGSRLLRNVKVVAKIAKRSQAHAEKLDITAECILEAIAKVAFGDIRGMFDENGRLLRPSEWDDETAAAVAGVDVVTVNLGEGEVDDWIGERIQFSRHPA